MNAYSKIYLEDAMNNLAVMLDYGCLVVHVFTEETRQLYDLERLWADAEKVDLNDILLPE